MLILLHFLDQVAIVFFRGLIIFSQNAVTVVARKPSSSGRSRHMPTGVDGCALTTVDDNGIEDVEVK